MKPDPYDWQMARRVARLAAHAPGRGLPRWELIARLGDASGFDLWVRLAYARGWVDCVRDYVVAPTLGPGPGGVAWENADTPLFPRAPAPLGVPPTHGPGGSPVRREPLFP